MKLQELIFGIAMVMILFMSTLTYSGNNEDGAAAGANTPDFSIVDLNGNDYIETNEARRLVPDFYYFDIIDTDQNGKLDAEEYKELIHSGKSTDRPQHTDQASSSKGGTGTTMHELNHANVESSIPEQENNHQITAKNRVYGYSTRTAAKNDYRFSIDETNRHASLYELLISSKYLWVSRQKKSRNQKIRHKYEQIPHICLANTETRFDNQDAIKIRVWSRTTKAGSFTNHAPANSQNSEENRGFSEV